MHGFITKRLEYLLQKRQIDQRVAAERQEPDTPLSKSLKQNMQEIQAALSNSNDLVIREFSFGKRLSIDAAVVFIDGMADIRLINESIVAPLMYQTVFLDTPGVLVTPKIEQIKDAMISSGDVKDTDTIPGVLDACISGDAVLLVDGFALGLVVSSKGFERRPVGEPATESVIRGPREAFTENIRTNTSLLRRKIRTPELTIEMRTLGKRTRTRICIAYIKGIADDALIDTVRKRLDKINSDAILESSYIEEYIEDSPLSLFPTMNTSEKPDVVAGRMLEGRVAVMIDGSPFVITAPMLFVETFQSAEDYYARPYLATFFRFIRYLAFFVTIIAPAAYVAMSTYHQELIPTKLLFTMVSAREGTPFPAAVDAIIMGAVFEILREAGIRLPRPVGQAISIVGALVMGESAVSAGIIGAPMVIVVALTAVSSFVVSYVTGAALVLRMIMTLMAATMGGVGITLTLIGALVYIASLESFGVPYLSPIVPYQPLDFKDTVVRAPLWQLLTRPNQLSKQNRIRQKATVSQEGRPNPGGQAPKEEQPV